MHPILQRKKTCVSCTHGSSNKYVFRLLAKVSIETDAERMLAGKLFHRRMFRLVLGSFPFVRCLKLDGSLAVLVAGWC